MHFLALDTKKIGFDKTQRVRCAFRPDFHSKEIKTIGGKIYAYFLARVIIIANGR